MTLERQGYLYGTALAASGITLYAWVARFLFVDVGSLESETFNTAPWIFILYAASHCCALLTGPKALQRTIFDKVRPGNAFCLSCLLSAWCGVALTSLIGTDGLGGVTIKFYWWGLAIIWSILVAGIFLFAAQSRQLAMRDWTVYAYALCWLPAIIFISYPAWRILMNMTPNEAAVTAAFMPFAGIFVLAHWFIVDVIDDSA